MRMVTAGVIQRDGAFLIAKRRAGGDLSGLWEFPGGKVKPGEDDRSALKRELREELAIEVAVGDFIASVPFVHRGQEFELKAFRAEWKSGRLELREHDEVRWVRADEFNKFDFAESDRAIIESLLR